jgi:hypothetical protein
MKNIYYIKIIWEPRGSGITIGFSHIIENHKWNESLNNRDTHTHTHTKLDKGKICIQLTWQTWPLLNERIKSQKKTSQNKILKKNVN